MAKQKHLTLVERCTIESMLNSSASFKEIGRKIGRDCTTISKEVRNHILFKKTGCPVVQMDSIIGTKGGKILLTIHFVKDEFMLAFLRDRNNAASVFCIFEELNRNDKVH